MTPIIHFFFFAFISAAFSYFIDFCKEEGNIFGRYGMWLEDKYMAKKWYAKPLGYCIVCANVWHSVAIYLICFNFDPFVLIAFIVTANFIVRKM